MELSITTSVENIEKLKKCDILQVNGVKYVKLSHVFEFMNEQDKLNEEHLAKPICPKCKSEYISYLPEEYYRCSECDNTWVDK